MFPVFSILRFLNCVPAVLEFVSLTNKLANGFNRELRTTIGTGAGTGTDTNGNEFVKTLLLSELDKEATTLSTRPLTTKFITESTQSFEVTSTSFFFLPLGGTPEKGIVIMRASGVGVT